MAIVGDTIAAIATAPGRGGIAVIRVSGPDAFAIAERLTGRPTTPFRISVGSIRVELGSSRVNLGSSRVNLGSIRVELGSSRVNLGSIRVDLGSSRVELGSSRVNLGSSRVASTKTLNDPNPTLSDPNLTLIDQCVVLAFRAPRSYTGEDVVEFQCHGGAVTPRRVLDACLSAGARLARRGEFTERAFLNGRITYEQAGAVLDLIDARTAVAADAALRALGGAADAEMRSLYDGLLDVSSRLEHALDVSEDELPPGFAEESAAALASIASRLAAALRAAREGRILREGALVVISGPPNAGKSSLLNALLGESRAIVSETPGTTRDSIEEWLDIGGWPVRLVDTAGLREAADEIEGEGVARARALASKADVVLRLSPCDIQLPTGDDWQSAATVIDVSSKCDLGRGPGLNVSAKTGEGLGELRRAVADALARMADEARADGVDASPCERRAAALAEALALLGGGCRAGASDVARDLVVLADRARSAASRLGEEIGAEYSSDVLDALFSRFCVGK